MIISAFMSVFVTHRFAGPLYRFHQVVDQMAAGDLSGQFKLRKGDDLVELEMAMNRAIESLAGTIQQAKRPLGDLTHRLETLLEEIREGSGHSLEKDLAELSQIAQEAQTALARLKVARE
jgi:methyl-accepting chemotaxis protein